MTSWFRQHGFALGAALVHLRKAPGSFLFNILVVAIALALPFMGLTLLDNVRPLSEQMSVDPEISLFMKQDVAREQSAALATPLRELMKDAKIIFVPREKALDNLKGKSGLSDVIATLGENPLPDSYIVKLDAFRSAAAGLDVDLLAEQMRALPGVDTVQIDSAWVKRLAALIGILKLALLLLAATLANNSTGMTVTGIGWLLLGILWFLSPLVIGRKKADMAQQQRQAAIGSDGLRNKLLFAAAGCVIVGMVLRYGFGN
eukprot:gene37739-46567_t